MAQSSDPSAPAGPPLNYSGSGGNPPTPLTAEQIREALADKYVCPFCGSINEADQGICPRCTMENSAASRKATKTRIGPWYVLQTRNPAAPGMKFETLLSFVRKGRVKARSIVRGPTTHQLWRFAAHVKGLSREFGVCYSCNGSITAATSVCPQCNRLQDPPGNPDALLESSRDANAPVGAPNGAAPTGSVNEPAAAGSASSKVQEPSLESADADFVVPALGNLTDSMAGFSLGSDSNSGSVAGMPFEPSWARIDPRNGNGGGAYGSMPPRGGMGRPGGVAAGRPTPPNSGRRPPREGEGFLSAKDLAAAFQLDFKPEPEGDGPVAAPVSPRQKYVPPAATELDDTDALFAPPRSRGRIWKAVALIVTLAVGCAAVALWLDDDLRHQALEVIGKGGPASDSDGKARSGAVQRATKPPPAKVPATPADKSRDAASAAVRANKPAAPKANEKKPGADWPENPPASEPTSEAPADSAVANPVPATEPSRPQQLSDIQAMNRQAQLYHEAHIAEGLTDWATAAQKYKQIMQEIPKVLWMGDVETNARRDENLSKAPKSN